MALPSSGPISLSQVSVELDASATSTRSLNEASTRELFEVPSGTISLSDGYGKANVFVLNINANATNVDIRALAVSAGWNLNSKVIVNIAAGVYISSNVATTPALSITGSFPRGAELINDGTIIGMGGAGGAGGNAPSYSLELNGTAGGPGGSGGSAFFTSVTTSVTNNGSLIGGGGGGGGGGAAQYIGEYYGFAGGGGGGGQSNFTLNSAGGAAGLYNIGGSAPVAGTVGTNAFAGQGGAGGNGVGGTAGNGGNLGLAGTSGGPGNGPVGIYGYNNYSGGSAGGAGASASGDTYITWVATGTRIGPVVA